MIAIILTIMVLELKSPESPDRHALLHEWPIFISYVISFFYVAVYWINHHHLFHRVKRVDLPILWANIAVLFCMSLIPFFTEWMESTRLSAFPTAVYAAVMLVNGAAFSVLNRAVGRQSIASPELVLLERAAMRKNLIAIVIYAIAIPAAYYRATLSLALIFLVALLYAIPSPWVVSVVCGGICRRYFAIICRENIAVLSHGASCFSELKSLIRTGERTILDGLPVGRSVGSDPTLGDK